MIVVAVAATTPRGSRLCANDTFDTGFVLIGLPHHLHREGRAARPYDSLALLWEHGVRTVRDVMVRRDAVEKVFTVFHRVTNDMTKNGDTLMVLLFCLPFLGCVDWFFGNGDLAR